MAVPTLSRFLEILRLSGLIDEDDLTQFLTKEYGTADLPETTTPQDLAERLLKAGVITSWHAEKLLDGKYKGFRLGNYRLRDFLGSGGMSSVYLAEHVHMHQSRAVKVLPRKKNDESSRLKRFYLEAKASAQLRHPNIVQVYDIDSQGDDIHYIVMEYVHGRDLAKAVREDGPLPFDLCLSYMIQAAEALQHAHENGLVHRDVKPGNFLVDDKGTLKCMDLGLALFAAQDDHSLTQEFNEKVLGTADYLSPEQALNSHNVDYRADIYSLGCTIYYCLTGSPPFPEGTLAQRILNHQTRMPEDPRVFRPDIPQAFVDLIWRMIQKRPEDRLQTASAVAFELRRLQTQGWDSAAASTGAAVPASSSGVRPVSSVGNRPAGGSSPGSSSDVRNKPPSKIEKEAIAARDSATGRSGPQAAPTTPAAPTPAAPVVTSRAANGTPAAAPSQAPVDPQRAALAAIAADRQAQRAGARRMTPADGGKQNGSTPSDSQRGRSSEIGSSPGVATPATKAPVQAAAKPAGSGPVRIEVPTARTGPGSGSSPGARTASGPVISVAKTAAAGARPAGSTSPGVAHPASSAVVKTTAPSAVRPAPAVAEPAAEGSAAARTIPGRRSNKKGLKPLMIVLGVVGILALAGAMALAILFSGGSTSRSEGSPGSGSGGGGGASGRRDTSSIDPPIVRRSV